MTRVQRWLWMAGAVLAVLVGAYGMGGRAARRSAQVKRDSAASDQRRKTNVVDTQMAEMDDDGVRSELASWVRDDRD